jgi:hypothetical protein
MTAFSKKRPHFIPAVVAGLMLLAAFADQWGNGYYEFLTIVVCVVAVYVTVLAYKWQRTWAVSLFGLIAILFNPLAPVHLSRVDWAPIDLVCGLLFLLATLVVRQPADGQRNASCLRKQA